MLHTSFLWWMSVQNIKTKSKNELKETDIKIRKCYYFDDIITDRDIYSVDVLLDAKIYENISVYTKLQRVQNHCVLGSVK